MMFKDLARRLAVPFVAAMVAASIVTPAHAQSSDRSGAGSAASSGGPRTDGAVIFNGLNKVTARIVELEAPIGRPTAFGTLIITPKACQKAPPEEPPESAVFLKIDEHKPGEVSRPLFSGWMFASSPGLSALDHPIYDLWVVDCRFPANPSDPAADAPGKGEEIDDPGEADAGAS